MSDTVVITASEGAFPGLMAALQKIPVSVEEHPLMNFAPPSDWAPLETALNNFTDYGSVVFTSPRAAVPFVAHFQERWKEWPRGLTLPVVWASGPQTAAALKGVLGQVNLPGAREVGRSGAAKALALAMFERHLSAPVLFPCGEAHREELPALLREREVRVDEVVCYRSVLAAESEARIAASRASVLVVASPRVAGLLARACHTEPRPELLAVGPTTAEAARVAGWSPSAVASEPTAHALVAALRSLLANR
jgi:uroporphyrinogen III methyltransferase / synthase